MTTSKKDKTKKWWNMLDEKKKATQQVKQMIQLKEINQKILAKEGRVKRYHDRIKQ